MKTIPTYTFDHDLPPASRWDALPQRLRDAGRLLAGRAFKELTSASPLASSGVALLRLATKWRNPYRDEITGATRVLGISTDQAMATNFLYELGALGMYGQTLWGRLSARFRPWMRACTSGAVCGARLGMVHVRSLDWPLRGLGRHTLVIHHINVPAGDFYSVGWPGYSGVLSGFKPGKFSASINQAFCLQTPNLNWPPAHLLRTAFEECASCADALYMLRNTPVSVPAFVLLAGPGKAAVLELTPEGSRVHPMSGGRPIAIANDYLSGRWRKEMAVADDEEFDYLVGDTGTSRADEPAAEPDNRRNTLLCRLRDMKPRNMGHALRILQAWPMQHEDTMQQMVFTHREPGMIVVGREADDAVCRFEVDAEALSTLQHDLKEDAQ